ncbi:hypothetical protein LCGC14_1142040 [marine sediment metagenome]|uniref:Uncharacterized protein n=1 Tax=marine sediment metagenome TaxID=412755 RepID=A0A0F9PG43_9ZZZZ
MGIFGSSSKKIKPAPLPQLSEEGRGAETQLRSFITSGLEGRGLTPEITQRAEQSLLAEIEKQKGVALADLPGRLNRFIPAEDERVRTFATEEIGREAARQRFNVEREFDLIPGQETQEAIDLGLTSVAGEKRLALTLASRFNQQQLRLAQSPTFGSEFSSGLGSGIGQFAGSKQGQESAQQLFSRLFNQSNSFFRQ